MEDVVADERVGMEENIAGSVKEVRGVEFGELVLEASVVREVPLTIPPVWGAPEPETEGRAPTVVVTLDAPGPLGITVVAWVGEGRGEVAPGKAGVLEMLPLLRT